MDYVTITSPKKNSPNPIVGGVFAAFGRADETIIGVVGTCTPKSDSGRPIRGALLDFRRATDKDGEKSYRWVIGFKLDPAEYELKVVGSSESGPAATDTVEIGPPNESSLTLREDHPDSSSRIHLPLAPLPGYPQPGDDISTKLGSGTFQPYGPLTDNSGLDTNSVRLELANSNLFIAARAAGGNAGDPTWWAEFDALTGPLVPGDMQEIFTLHLADTSGNILDIPDLIMNFF
jgi:hypothetical protein